MKAFPFIVLLFLFETNVFAQEGHPRYSILYSLSQSNMTNSYGGKFTPGLSSSIMAKMEFGKKTNLKYSIGFGYLQPHTVFKDYTGVHNYLDEERHYRLDYLVLPVGINIKLGSFYIHPEFAPSYNFNISTKSFIVDAEMERTGEVYRDEKESRSFDVDYAAFLALGYEYKIGNIHFLSAIKGFLALNSHFIDTYGVGLEVGIKI